MNALDRLRSEFESGGLARVLRVVLEYAGWRLFKARSVWRRRPPIDDWIMAYGGLRPAHVPDAGVSISVVCPVYNTPVSLLEQCVRSVVGQTYGNWELVLVDDASTDESTLAAAEMLAAENERIRLIRLDENQGIVGATNEGAAAARGEFLAFLDHDDILMPTALEWVASVAPDADLVYSDEAKLTEEGGVHSPFFKPSWSPRLLLSLNYVNHLLVVRRALFESVGGLRHRYEGAQDHDLLLRVSEEPSLRVVHLPDILYLWRDWSGSTAARSSAKTEAEANGIAAVQDALDRRGWAARAGLGAGAPFNYRPWFSTPIGSTVKVVVPTRDRPELLHECLTGLLTRTDDVGLDIVVVDNGSRRRSTLDYLKQVVDTYDNVSMVRIDDAFNYSRLCNAGASVGADTPYTLFLNNDTEIQHRGWLRQLAGWLEHDEQIVAVGPKLLFPKQTIQHAGVIIGFGDIAGHYASRMPDEPRGGDLHDQAREVGALTAACLLVRTEAFWKVGGFREELPIDFQDVDLCLRLRRDLGGVLMYDPSFPLVHRESATRAKVRAVSDYTVSRMEFLWGPELAQPDAYYSPHLSLTSHDLSLAPVPSDVAHRLDRLAPR